MNDTSRRTFLSGAATAAALLLAGCNRSPENPASATGPVQGAPAGPANVTLHIGPVLADIAKEHTISTIGYDGSVPGPLIRFKEGVAATVDLFNETDSPELVHWHGQIIPASVDGAAEENSLVVPARGHLRYRFTPQPSGARFVHIHVMSMSDLNRGTYTGQFGFVYIEPKDNPGRFDQEAFWRPTSLSRSSGPKKWTMATKRSRDPAKDKGGSGQTGEAERVGKSVISASQSTASVSDTVSLSG